MRHGVTRQGLASEFESPIAEPVPVSEESNDPSKFKIDIEFICRYVKKEISALTREVRKVAHLNINDILKESASENGQGTLLHGSDVPAKINSFKIKIKEFRKAPDGFKGAVGIVDIEEVHGCTAWALNKTNAKALATLLGPETTKWAGKQVVLLKIQTRNPSKGTTVPSLAVDLE